MLFSEIKNEKTSFREDYQLMHGWAYDDYRVGIEEAIKSDLKIFFGYVDLKKKVVWHLVLMTSTILLLILCNKHKIC
jgi:hypothetical protein